MQLKPFTGTYAWLADDDQLQTLFMITLEPPFVIGRVICLDHPSNWSMLDVRKIYYAFVTGYDIVVAFEKTLVPSTNPDEWLYCINNMAHLMLHWRISKHPEKYIRWCRKPL